MKAFSIALLSLSILAFDITWAEDFPTSPSNQLTPGRLCTRPDSFRYAEKIPYCDRNVSPETKLKIMAEYDQTLGFRILQMPREQFKIDHFIPLCAGGSNDRVNLWPQHESVYTVTDVLEEMICLKMQKGRLLQKDAVQLIIHAKTNLDLVPSIMAQVNKF